MAVRALVTDVTRRFAELVHRVVYRGARVILVRGGRPGAEPPPVPVARTGGELVGVFASLPRLTPDEARAFDEELAAARAALREPSSPWES